VSIEKRRGLRDERAQQLERMRNRDCWPRGEFLFREGSLARAPGNLVRRAPSARCDLVPDTRGRVRMSYTWSTGLRVRRRQTAAWGTIRRTIARRFGTAIGIYFFLTEVAVTRHPVHDPMEPLDVGQSATGTDVAVGMTEGELTACTSPVIPCRRKIQVLDPPVGSYPPLRWARGPLLVP
jgi:hypothetical protein